MKEPYPTYKKIIYIGLFGAIIFYGSLFLAKVAHGQEYFFNEDFDTDYSLGNIDSQNNWSSYVVSSGTSEIVSTQFNSSPYSLEIDGWEGSKIEMIATSTSMDRFSFWFKGNQEYSGATTDQFRITPMFISTGSTNPIVIELRRGASNTEFRFGIDTNVTDILITENLSENTWHYIEIEIDFASRTYSYRTNTEDSFTPVGSFSSTGTYSSFSGEVTFLNTGWPNNTFWFDDFGNIPNSNTTSRITWDSPTASTTSRTFDIDVTYYINSTASTTYNSIGISLSALSYPEDSIEHFSINSVEYDQIISTSTSVTVNRDGQYLGLVSLWNGVEESTECSWWEIWCEENQVIIGATDSETFNVATTTIEADVPDWITGFQCENEFTGVIDGALCNIAMFLFMPSENSIQNFTKLQQKMATKLPFGFFFDIKNKIENLENTEITAGSDVIINTGFGDTTIFSFSNAKTSFESLGLGSTTVSNILKWILWLLFGFYIFHRITKGIKPSENAI